MKIIALTRGPAKWLTKASNAQIVEEICQQQGWEFDTITEIQTTVTDIFKKWKLGELIDKIGPKNNLSEALFGATKG